MKSCLRKKCSQINPQPLINFFKNKRNVDGFDKYCKECKKDWVNKEEDALRAKEYRLKNKEKVRIKRKERYEKNPNINIHRNLRRYDMSIEQYNDLLKAQNNSCAICYTSESNLNRRLSVDHCHKTNKVRGLLCINCNSAIGLLKTDDGIDLLKNAIKYIKKGLIKV